MNIILDTNVIVSGMRSRHGASNRLLRLLGQRNWHANLSVPLLLEYEEICKRIMPPLGISIDAIDEFLDYLCSVCEHRRIFYLWRPALPDADEAISCWSWPLKPMRSSSSASTRETFPVPKNSVYES
uniref:PIN domain-containing protein n=1 Tax=Candidatus Kentrum sp. LPFa TaxID=2126335 RepID=A0A450VX47_9GAMM|nr:MAG: PIN domain-containing protein [Candidatus Kentron sp. LPFa]